MTATIDGRAQAIQPGELLIDLINRSGVELPQVCYHPQLGPIQSCDTCMVGFLRPDSFNIYSAPDRVLGLNGTAYRC